MSRPLHIRLLDAGIPVVVCRPHVHHKKCPSGCTTELTPPTGWSTATAEQARVAIGHYRPGVDTLAGVGGHGIDILDIDTKAGGNPACVPANLRMFGQTRTPSGGYHFPVPSTGYGKGDLFIGGVYQGDYVGGTKAGGGRLLFFLPGSTRPKYPGAGYVEEEEWNIDALLNAQPGEALLTIVTESGLSTDGGPGERPATSTEVRDFVSAHVDPVDCPYGQAALTGMLDETRHIIPSNAERGRHPWASRTTNRVVELVKAGCLDAPALDAVRAELERMKPGSGAEADDLVRWAVINTEAKSACERHDPDLSEFYGVQPLPTGSRPIEDDPEPPDMDDPEPPAGEGKRGRSLASMMVQAAQRSYRIGLTLDERPFLVPHTGPNVALLSAKAKRSLSLNVSNGGSKVPSHTARDEAWGVIEAMAYEADKEALPLRLASHDGGAILDLGRTDGTAVRISADGWTILDRSPVTFRRSKTMLPLPTPTRGGSVDTLWGIVNVDPVHRHLFAAWLACTLLPNFPHSVVQIGGEQGSAKTTAATIMGRLVDPCVAAIVGPPRDDAHWISMAGARWVLPVDNVSHIQPWWSDALARSTTGAGDLKRALYTDDDVSAVAYKLCTILNGISLTSAMRSDLAERLIPFSLRRPDAYMTEAEVEARFTAMHAAVLGALLDLAVGILRAKASGTVQVPSDLRMADMAEALACYDEHVAAGSDGALAVYRRQVEDAFAETLESDPVARALLAFMAEHGDTWEGTAGELLAEVDARREALKPVRDREDGEWWAKTPTMFVRNLPRSGPALHRAGVKVTIGERSKKGRIVRLTRVNVVTQ